MAPLNPNLALGELMNNPLFWVLIVVVGGVTLAYYMGWFDKVKFRKEFKAEDLNESLMKDLKPRMIVQGKKIKNTKLVQGQIDFGKVRKVSKTKVEFHSRKSNIGKKTPQKLEKEVKSILQKEEVEMVYFTVGGNTWLSWIPVIGKNYEPEYFIFEDEFIKFEPQSRIYTIDKDVHVYPYAKIWICSKKTQRYLTELEARRTQEFESETNINTLKRWTYYNEPQSGRVVVMEKDTQLEQDKWDHTRETHG